MRFLTDQTAEKLGYNEVRKIIESFAVTESAKTICRELQPFLEIETAKEQLKIQREFKVMLHEEAAIPLEYESFMVPIFQQVAVQGSWLTVDELMIFGKWYQMAAAILRYFKSRKSQYPLLWKEVQHGEVDEEIQERLKDTIEKGGGIKDSATPELRKIRREMIRSTGDLRKHLNSTLRNALSKGWTSDKEITIRNDRLVIPLNADFKGKVSGFVHDVSQSGKTIYLEPSDSLEMNNRIRQLIASEKNEVTRILMEITSMIRERLDGLYLLVDIITEIDVQRAKAKLALEIDGQLPKLRMEGDTELIGAYHPLLLRKELGKDRKIFDRNRSNVISLSLRLEESCRIIVISGPNAGGKTVAMKTVGLMQLMIQSGMLVPVDIQSRFRWFDKIFADIGDEQSIQSDLSTYTSHLDQLNHLIKEMDDDTLFFADEFGTGTDPRLGGAIAEAFMETFYDKGGWGVVTTHYGNLKHFADAHQGFQNAAMQFDPIHLTPTYQMNVGLPGKSYAFEIARNVGVPEDILEKARGKTDGGELYTEELLLKLEEQKAELENVLKENRQINAELKTILKKNKGLQTEIEAKRTRILSEAQEKAKGLINQANSKIERTIEEIRGAQAEKERTKKLRKELTDLLPKKPLPMPEETPQSEDLPDELPVEYDWVRIKNTENIGELIQLQAKRGVVAIGEMRITVKLKDLVKIKAQEKEKQSGGNVNKFRINKRTNVSTELNIMGLRVEAAMPVFSKFMDDAIVAGVVELRILHGKGTGALREAIRDSLKAYPEVGKISDAAPEAGGNGWTIVKLGN